MSKAKSVESPRDWRFFIPYKQSKVADNSQQFFIHKSSKKLPKAALRNHRVRRPPLRPTNRPFQSSKWDPKFQVKPTSKRKDHNERPNSAPRGRIGRADCSRSVGRRPCCADRQPGEHRES